MMDSSEPIAGTSSSFQTSSNPWQKTTTTLSRVAPPSIIATEWPGLQPSPVRPSSPSSDSDAGSLDLDESELPLVETESQSGQPIKVTCLFCYAPVIILANKAEEDVKGGVVEEKLNERSRMVKSLCQHLELCPDLIPPFCTEERFPFCSACGKLVRMLWENEKLIQEAKKNIIKLTTDVERTVADAEIVKTKGAAGLPIDAAKLREMIYEGYRNKLLMKQKVRELQVRGEVPYGAELKLNNAVIPPEKKVQQEKPVTEISPEKKQERPRSDKSRQVERPASVGGQVVVDGGAIMQDKINPPPMLIKKTILGRNTSATTIIVGRSSRLIEPTTTTNNNIVRKSPTKKATKAVVVAPSNNIAATVPQPPPVDPSSSGTPLAQIKMEQNEQLGDENDSWVETEAELVGLEYNAQSTLPPAPPEAANTPSIPIPMPTLKREIEESYEPAPPSSKPPLKMRKVGTRKIRYCEGIQYFELRSTPSNSEILQCGACTFHLNSTKFRSQGKLPIWAMREHILKCHLDVVEAHTRSKGMLKGSVTLRCPEKRRPSVRLPRPHEAVTTGANKGVPLAAGLKRKLAGTKRPLSEPLPNRRHAKRPMRKSDFLEVPVTCDICARPFYRKCSLANHMKTHRPNLMEDPVARALPAIASRLQNPAPVPIRPKEAAPTRPNKAPSPAPCSSSEFPLPASGPSQTIPLTNGRSPIQITKEGASIRIVRAEKAAEI